MSETIDRDKLIEWFSQRESEELNNAERLLNESYYKGKADAFSDAIEQIQSGAFDIPNNHLREALSKIEDEMADDTSPRAQRINKIVMEVLNTSVTEPSVDRVNDNPIAQAIREFMPTEEQQAGYNALVAWLESTTSFISEPSEDNARREGGNEG